MLRHKIGTLAVKIWQLIDDSKKGEISTKELIDNNEAEIKKWSCIWLWVGLHAKIKLLSR
jgi:hypothetical protein